MLQNPPLTNYEKERLDRMKRNEGVLQAYGVRRLAASLKEGAGQNSTTEPRHSRDPDEDDEYVPEKEPQVESDEDISEMEVPCICLIF